MVNEAIGWLWITLGFVSGIALGMGFRGERFLGGYGSWPRRLLRLGHISFFGLGLLNALFALSAERVNLPPVWLATASWGLIVGACSMPLACAIAAFAPRAHPLFAVPVVSLTTSGVLITAGLMR